MERNFIITLVNNRPEKTHPTHFVYETLLNKIKEKDRAMKMKKH